MVLATLIVPLPVNVIPLFVFKVIVSVINNVPPLNVRRSASKLEILPNPASVLIDKIPAEIVVIPVWVFVPDKTKVPVPALVNTAASPSLAITPVISEEEPVLVTLIVPPTFRSTALKSFV